MIKSEVAKHPKVYTSLHGFCNIQWLCLLKQKRLQCKHEKSDNRDNLVSLKTSSPWIMWYFKNSKFINLASTLYQKHRFFWHFLLLHYISAKCTKSNLHFTANESSKKHEGTDALNNKYWLLISWHLGCGVTFRSVAPLRSFKNANENLDSHEPFASCGLVILF